MTAESNSKIFTDTVFGVSSDQLAADLTEKDRTTQESYLSSSSYSNMGTELPRVPSNQRVAKGS
jgi:hypothetical protein